MSESTREQTPALAAGDLLLHWGRGFKSRAIELFTRGPSHVSIVLESIVTHALYVFESTTLCDQPCAWCHKPSLGVQAHEPADRIANYPGIVMRLPLKRPLWRDQSQHLTRTARREFPCGTGYDLRGALESGPKLKHWRAFLPYPDMASIFCSALVASLLQEVGKMNRSDPKRFSPADLVDELRRTAVYGPPEPIDLSALRRLAA